MSESAQPVAAPDPDALPSFEQNQSLALLYDISRELTAILGIGAAVAVAAVVAGAGQAAFLGVQRKRKKRETGDQGDEALRDAHWFSGVWFWRDWRRWAGVYNNFFGRE